MSDLDILDAGHLDDPTVVGRVHVVLDGPLGQRVPLVVLASVDGQAELDVLVLALLEVGGDLFEQLGEELAVDVVVHLDEYVSEARLADRIVFGVEFVEAMERVAILAIEKICNSKRLLWFCGCCCCCCC